MKKNWFTIPTFCVLLISVACGQAAENVLNPASVVGLDDFGYPTNTIIALELGRADAALDVNKGLLRVPMYGLPTAWSSDFNQLLKQKYGVERYGLGGCDVSQSLTEYERGYGEISSQAIKEKFGTNFFAQAEAEAKQVFEQRMRDMAAVTAAKRDTIVATSNRMYRVKAGDSFWGIAKQHGVSVASLTGANPGVRPERLQINHSLILPSPARQ